MTEYPDMNLLYLLRRFQQTITELFQQTITELFQQTMPALFTKGVSVSSTKQNNYLPHNEDTTVSLFVGHLFL